jgi:biopolymer transport protein ExbD
MSWKVRHQGSPKAVGDLTQQQIVDGLLDGAWEPTDEVMGPGESQWTPLESHPYFEEIAADIEPPPPKVDTDETRLDMTPLIDVCLVLLIFMILTISYGTIQKQLEAAESRRDQDTSAIKKTPQKVPQTMIVLRVDVVDNVAKYNVENKDVPEDQLAQELTKLAPVKPELLVEWGPNTRRKTIVTIQDAALAAGIPKITVQPKK